MYLLLRLSPYDALHRLLLPWMRLLLNQCR
jgi:hypothetical protein